MKDHYTKSRWEQENVIRVTVKVNRNQDPDLFDLLTKSTSKSGTIRELLREAIQRKK